MMKIVQLLKPFLPYVVGFIGIISLFLYVDSRGYRRAEDKYRAEIDKIEKKSYEAEIVAWKQKYDFEQRSKQNAEKANASYVDLKREFDANLLRFAKANRAGGQASTATGSHPSVLNYGPGSNTEFSEIKVTYEDAAICSENTARLLNAHEWGKSLLAAQSNSSKK